MNKKTAQKWKKATKEKNQKSETSPTNTATFLIKTHERSVSEAQILVPSKYKQFAKPDSILIIQAPNKEFLIYVQVTKETLRDEQIGHDQKCEISVLKNVADLYGAVYIDKGVFRGDIRVVSEKHFLPTLELQYAEILIRNNYFSRRDQYKVSQLLKEKITHVYSRKILYFESTRVEVTNMLKSNHEILRTGFITKNTKLIFRSGCSKTAILVELSKEAFDMNSTRELYLDRMIQFLIVYFNRNLFFQNQHRVEIVLYARLFYPEFRTLTEAYNYLLKQATIGSTENKFEVNYAVSLQKDFKGRIYQDAYRKVIWESSNLLQFKKYFLEKVSEFLFTLNWECNKSRQSEFISKSINSKVRNEFECVEIPQTWKIKPFIHRMKCELADSANSNLFQALCLVSEQYKHHYKFRALDETGNAIIVLSAGRSEYETDRTTFQMAKSYIYLTNISCMMVNVNKKVDKIRVHVYDLPKQVFKDENDIRKLRKLIHWCIQEYVYQSPVNQKVSFNSHKAGFLMKSFIYPQDILPIASNSDKFKYFGKENCHCANRHGMLSEHFYLNEPEQLPQFDFKLKEIDWISSYFVNNEAIKVHEKFYERFYEKANFQIDFYQPFNRNVLNQYNKEEYRDLSYSFLNELDVFEDDLQKAIIKKESWFSFGPVKNELNLRFDKYTQQLTSIKKKGNEQQIRNELNDLLSRTNRKMFEAQVTRSDQMVDFDLASNEDYTDRSSRMNEFSDLKARSRKNSQYMEEVEQILKPKVNIFEQTLRNKEYNIASMSKEKSKKFLSHNKQRLRGNYKESSIHYMMSYFSQANLKKLAKVIRKEFYESQSQEQIKINESFECEKQWKNICFPILTPIYTKYRENFKEIEFIFEPAETGDDKDLENEACRLLMENYQLSQVNANKTVFKFSKGCITKTLQKIDNTISKTFSIDKLKQQSLIPFLLYRYLLYEEKDYRFCSKTLYFQDKNFYDKQKKDIVETQTKSLKLLFLYDPCDDFRDSMLSYNPASSVANLQATVTNKKSPFEDFKRLFKEKFQKDMVVLQIKNQQPLCCLNAESSLFNDKKEQKKASPDRLLKTKNSKQNSKKSFASLFSVQQREKQPTQNPKTREIQFSLGSPSNKKYNSEEIKMIYDGEFCQKNLFKIVLEWDHCSSILVSEFVDNLITIGRRSKFNSFKTTTENVFNPEWNMNVVGEIVFSNEIAVEMLESFVYRKDDWYYDSMGFYMDYKGIAYIKFQKQKKLVLWKDNNYEKKNRQPQLYNEEYHKFFMLSAAFDFLGEMIEQSYQIYTKKNPQHHINEKTDLENFSLKGSYNSEEIILTPNKKT